jgi:hypothetical protein
VSRVFQCDFTRGCFCVFTKFSHDHNSARYVTSVNTYILPLRSGVCGIYIFKKRALREAVIGHYFKDSCNIRLDGKGGGEQTASLNV